MALSDDSPEFTAPVRSSLARRLLKWFDAHQRDLPWRENRDPYRIWVSEIMLQQTTVAAVVPYFQRFVASFPTVESLAAATEAEVLRHWEGLGYYRRARQLHLAAQVVGQQWQGQWPREVEQVRELPGVGRYTAGAIVSLAFDTPAPILEANTVRLLSRLLGFTGDPLSTSGQKRLWAFAEALLPKTRCGDFNAALMELGSLVCSPRAPKCAECPLASVCRARVAGLQESIPAAKAKVKLTDVHEATVVVWKKNQVLLRQRSPKERWAGLWDFPRFELTGQRGADLTNHLQEQVRELTGVECRPGEQFATLRHGVTRFRITLDCYSATFSRSAKPPHAAQPTRWLPLAELAEVPLSMTGRKIVSLLVAEQHRSPRGPRRSAATHGE